MGYLYDALWDLLNGSILQIVAAEGCRWPGDCKSQGIIRHAIDLFLQDIPTLKDKTGGAAEKYRISIWNSS